MKLRRYNTEILFETKFEAYKAGRSNSPSGEHPIVLSYPYARGSSPIHLTLDEANELLGELKSAIERSMKNSETGFN